MTNLKLQSLTRIDKAHFEFIKRAMADKSALAKTKNIFSKKAKIKKHSHLKRLQKQNTLIQSKSKKTKPAKKRAF